MAEWPHAYWSTAFLPARRAEAPSGCVYFPSDLETFLRQNGSVAKSQGAITETYLNFLYLDDKLMDLPHDLAVKTLLLEKTCDLERPFGEKHLVIWTSKRQAS